MRKLRLCGWEWGCVRVLGCYQSERYLIAKSSLTKPHFTTTLVVTSRESNACLVFASQACILATLVPFAWLHARPRDLLNGSRHGKALLSCDLACDVVTKGQVKWCLWLQKRLQPRTFAQTVHYKILNVVRAAGLANVTPRYKVYGNKYMLNSISYFLKWSIKKL